MQKLIIIVTAILLFISCDATRNVKQGYYSGEEIMKTARIERNKTTKAARLVIETDGEWTLYGGETPERIDFNKPLLKENGSGTYPLAVSDSTRTYFQLITGKGAAIMAETHLPMDGGFNFRDLGGIRTTEGKHVKWGRFFRSDELHTLTDADLAYLSSIPITTIVDFRSTIEIERAPDKAPKSTQQEVALSIEPGNMMSLMASGDRKSIRFDSLMIQMNELMVTDSAIIDQYRQFFALLQDKEALPLLFHCSAGKDRTGMGAALILFALGVDEKTVLENYAASNRYLQGKYDALIAKYPEFEPLMMVRPEYLEAGIKKIKETYGSVENYLSAQLNIDLQRFREQNLD